MTHQFHFWTFTQENKIIYSKRYLYPRVITALFAIAKTRKQPKCLSVDDWIKKMQHYSAIKKKEIIGNNTDGP